MRARNSAVSAPATSDLLAGSVRILAMASGLLLVGACAGCEPAGGAAADPSPGAAPSDADPTGGVGDADVPLGAAAPDVARPESIGCGPTAPRVDDAWWRDAIVYEVFVRSFHDSDADGIGDLQGLIAKLDHLNDGDPTTDTDLGVDAIWLMPIHDAFSYHGYDVIDYRAIDPEYGTMADFDALIDACDARGIRVLLDLVVNHSSDKNPWFTDPDTRDWYVWRDDDPGWKSPTGYASDPWHGKDGQFYYGAFWSGMPDLDWTTQAVRDEMVSIAREWLDRGVAGFRLDAVRFLIETGEGVGQRDTPETHEAWQWFRAQLDETHPEHVLVGEAWAGRNTVKDYFGTEDAAELHMCFDFDMGLALIDAIDLGNPSILRGALCGVMRDYPEWAQSGVFLTNHDQRRVANELDRDPAKLKLAAALLFTLPGTPFVYYGEEIGLPNGNTPQDEKKRLPMPWDDSPLGGFTAAVAAWEKPYSGDDAPNVAAQSADPSSLLSTYRQLVRLRQGSPALRRGRTEVLPKESFPGEGLLAYVRHDDASGEAVLVVHEVQGSSWAGEASPPLVVDLDGLLLVPDSLAGRAGENLTVEYGSAAAAVGGGDGPAVTLTALPAHGTAVIAL